MKRNAIFLSPIVMCMVFLAACAADKAGEKTYKDSITGMEFVFVKGGCYKKVETVGDGDKEVEHEVCVDDFWIGKYEVTQGQWKKVIEDNPSRFKKGGSYPVEGVGWKDALEYLSKLGKRSGNAYRLPTEAEWNFAARGGVKGEIYPGEKGTDCADWFDCSEDPFNERTRPVGKRKPNRLGIYDMKGNVREWVVGSYDNDSNVYTSYFNAPPWVAPHDSSGNTYVTMNYHRMPSREEFIKVLDYCWWHKAWYEICQYVWGRFHYRTSAMSHMSDSGFRAAFSAK